MKSADRFSSIPHATADPVGDCQGNEALREIFGSGERCPPIAGDEVASPGTPLAQTGVAGGQSNFDSDSMQNEFISGHAHITELDPEFDDTCPSRTRRRDKREESACFHVSNSFGFAGTNATIVIETSRRLIGAVEGESRLLTGLMEGQAAALIMEPSPITIPSPGASPKAVADQGAEASPSPIRGSARAAVEPRPNRWVESRHPLRLSRILPRRRRFEQLDAPGARFIDFLVHCHRLLVQGKS